MKANLQEKENINGQMAVITKAISTADFAKVKESGALLMGQHTLESLKTIPNTEKANKPTKQVNTTKVTSKTEIRAMARCTISKAMQFKLKIVDFLLYILRFNESHIIGR